jgi:hypothetical protein
MATDSAAVARKTRLAGSNIDDAWSAFSLRRYRAGEARQTFR